MKWAFGVDSPFPLNTMFRTFSVLDYLVLSDILFDPSAITGRFVIAPTGYPRPDVIGPLASDFAVFECKIQMHPTAFGAMRLQIKAIPLT